MIYIETNSTDASINFAAEYYFAAEKRLPDTAFLFWRTEPTLMIGKYQNALEEIDKPYADRRGIKVVRRMSGGGTIYTDPGGWQFSFVARDGGGEIRFDEYMAPVLSALRGLGVDASFNGRNDLVISGRKFSGNAQYRLGGSVVHHGSLLYDTNLGELVRSTTVDAEKYLSKSIKSVRERVTNIAEHLPSPLSPEAFKELMVSSILGGGTRFEPDGGDWNRIREIARERFDSWEFTYGASPKFTVSRSTRFSGGKLRFRLDVQRGAIAAADLSGDFFALEAVEEIPKRLIGCAYNREAVRAALNGLDGAIYRVTLDEIAQAIVD